MDEMELIGTVESLWRYPVKSMRGEELQEAFVGFPGIFGDRLYAFRNSGAPRGFPYLTGRELETMLLYQPRYRNPERMTKPDNLAEAEAIAPGLTPVYPDAADLALDFGLKRQAGFVSLRRKQYELAMAGNATILIFLGKQYLGQADKGEVTAPLLTFEVEHILPEAYEESTAGSKTEMTLTSKTRDEGVSLVTR